MIKTIIISILLFSLFGCTPVKTTENKEPTIAIAQTGTPETNKAVTTNSGGNAGNNMPNKDNSWYQYSDSEFGFSISYPREAYMKTTCGNNTKDELIPLGIYKKGNKFIIGYSKKLVTKNINTIEDCKILDITSYDNLENGLKFEVFGAANKEDFIKKSSDPICKILNTESGNKNNSRFEKINIGYDSKDTKCGEENTSACDVAAFACSDGVRIFYPDLQKGIVYYPSHSDYYIQKYDTYKETIEKGSYDQGIIDSLKIEVTYP